MERIERALEVARLHRHRLGEVAPAIVPPPAQPGPALSPEPPPAPTFAEALAKEGSPLRVEDAPPVEMASRDQLRERCVVFPDETGPATLAYKMLRAQVLQRARQHGMRCIGVVSAASGEGKTVTAINLALSLAAEPNQTVVLLDLDLKRPAVAGLLGLSVEQGLERYFNANERLENLWRKLAGTERIAVIPTSGPQAGSSELLSSAATVELFRQLREVSGDPLILVDLPPALLSDDVLSVSPQLDGIVLVVTEEQTRREDIQRVFELLRSTPVIGTVLNGSAEAEARAY
jgi:Mrp family chromosome partitioning ATPase